MNIKPIYYDRGTTLVEVLVAALIVGIGMLGIASLQLKSLQGSSDAQYRATATDIAWSMTDRIRANLIADNSYSGVTGDCSVDVQQCAMIPTASDATNVVSCTPAQVAAYDVKSTLCTKNGAPELPNGTLSISDCIDADGGDADPCSPHSTFNITVTWSTRSDFDGTGNQEDKVVMTIVPGTEPSTGLSQ